MLILIIRTDKPEAEIGLYQDDQELSYEAWQAHRQLAESLLVKIEALLKQNKKTLQDVQGIVCFKGPGSFTGLRIGLSMANALAYGVPAPIVGETGEEWCKKGITRLQRNENEISVMPEYGADVHITPPKH